MSKIDVIDKMTEEELRVHAKQLEVSVKNLLFIVQCVNEAAGNASSCAEIYEARQLAGMHQ